MNEFTKGLLIGTMVGVWITLGIIVILIELGLPLTIK